MRPVAVLVSEKAVEASFRPGEGFDHQTELPEAWGANRNQKGLDGLDACGEVSKTSFDQLLARKPRRCAHRTHEENGTEALKSHTFCAGRA